MESQDIMTILESKDLSELEQIMRRAQEWIQQEPENARARLGEEHQLRFALWYIPQIIKQKREEGAYQGDSRQGRRQQHRDPRPQPIYQQQYPPPAYPQGYPAQGYQQGYPPQGYQQGYPHGYPPQGYPPQGYPPQGYPPQGYQQGYPPQGYQYYQQPDEVQIALNMTREEMAALPEQQRQRVMQIRQQYNRWD